MNERIYEKETNETITGSKELSLAPENKESRMTEVPELRGENRKVFRLNNKEQQAVFYPAPVHVFNEETQMYEEAADILTEEEDNGHYTCRRNHFAARFSKHKESDRLFTIESGEHRITVLESSANSGKGIIPKKARKEQMGKKKDVLTFAEVKSGTDYEYSVAGYGVKENIIVKEKTDDYRYSFILQCEHVTPLLVKAENRIAFLSNDTGEEVFFIPAPFMTDASGEISTEVSYELTEKTTGVVQLTVTADSGWMNDESRKFPVTIDPQISLSKNSAMNTYSWKNSSISPSPTHSVGVTTNADGTRNIHRVYIGLTMPSLPRNPRIKKAEITFAQKSSAGTGNELPKIGLYPTTGQMAGGLPVIADELMDFAMVKTGGSTEENIIRYRFDVTTLLQKLENGESTNKNLVLKLVDETMTENNSVILYGSLYEELYAPQLVITYESSYGVNTSYRTHTHELGSFGQGSIDLACGNLMFDFGDFAWSGNRMPVTIRHLYNSALSDHAYTYDPSIGLNLPDYGSMKLGNGFKLSLMQSMRPVSMVFDGEPIRYVYTDENGEESYFKLGTKKKCCSDNSQCYDLYENVDGRDMFYDNYEFTLEKGDEIYKFGEDGRLLSITDNAQRSLPEDVVERSAVEFIYDENVPTRIDSVRDGAGRIFAFSYDDNGFLTSIKAPDETMISYTYVGELLSSITYPDGRKAVIIYTEDKPVEVTIYDAEGNGVYKMVYTFDGDRVVYATEYGKKAAVYNTELEDSSETEEALWEQGVSNSYTYRAASGETIVLTTEPKDEGEGEESDTVIRTVYTFDDEGNVVSEYAYLQDMGNTGVEGTGSGIHPYAGDGGASMITDSINLLKNHSFTGLAEWTSIPDNAEDFAIDVYPSGYFGTHLLRMQSNNADSVANGVYQTTETLAAGTYTYSVYMKPVYEICGNVSQGAYIRVSAMDETVLAESAHLTKKNEDYIRLSVPFELAEPQAVKVEILMDGLGLLYADGAQLEDKSYESPYNLLENGSFERRSNWIGIVDETYTEEASFKGDYSMRMGGHLNYPCMITQDVNVCTSSSTRETFTLSGWAKGNGLPNHEREGVEHAPTFQLRAVIYYDDSSEEGANYESFTADFSPCTEEWQYASVEFSKSQYRRVHHLTVVCDYGYNTGTAYFDNIQLVRTNLETDLSASDFTWAGEEGTAEETVEEGMENTYTAPTFEEAEDEFGNALTETVFSDGEFGTIYRSFGYNDGVVMSYDEEGNEIFNTGNDLVRETDARGNVTTYLVDENTSRNKAVIDRCGNKTSYEYDETGKTTKVVSEKPKYNENGEKMTDETGEVIYEELANVSYSYDAFDNMTEILRGDGMKYVLGYNAFHNLETIGIEDKSEPLVKYTYKNGNGRLKSMTYANGHTMKATYNSTGQMTSEKWYETEAQAASSAEDDTITPMAHYKYVYDGQGNIVRSIDVLGEKEYNYSYENGRLIRATESDITLSNEIVTAKTVVHTIRYYYDSDGQMTRKVISPTGGEEQIIYYENNDSNTVVKFEAGDKTITSHSKTDSFGRKEFDELQLGTGFVSRQFSYHTGEVTDEHVANGKLKSSPTTQLVSNITFSDGRILSYEYDEEERITKVSDRFGDEETVTEYTYDALGQLLTETVNDEVVNTMIYDNRDGKGNYGNILSKNGIQYTYGDAYWKDLLTGYGGKTITYDAQGNPINYLGNTLTWEKGRQLKQFVKEDGTVIDYTYNANGIRTSKTIRDAVTGASETHTYTLDGTKILRETWTKDDVEHTIIPLYDNEDSVCGILYNGEPYYFQKNLQGDIIAIVDKNANTVVRYSYDAWGVCQEEDNGGCGIATINPYRYRGYYFDTEIEMYYLQSRYYDSNLGKFIKSDMPEMMLFQLEMATGTNLYTYCNNNPINGSDPMGIINATKVANWMDASAVFAMFAEGLYTAFSTTMTKISAYIIAFLTPKATAAFWWQPWVVVGIVLAAVAIVLLLVSHVQSQEVSKADAKVRSKVKRNSKTQYWSANLMRGYVDIGRGLTYKEAVSEVVAGRSVFTVTKAQAYAVALAAGGNATPMFHPPHQTKTGYYYHYHVNGHANGAHVWYLF